MTSTGFVIAGAALLAWVLAPWLPLPLVGVLLGAIGFRALVERPALPVIAALASGFVQLAWIPDAWILAGKGPPWAVYTGLAVWQSTAALVAVGLSTWIHRRGGGPVVWGLGWAVAQAFADLVVPLPALHATLAAEQPWALWAAALAGPAAVTGILAGLGAAIVVRPRVGLAAAVAYLGIGAVLGNLPSTGPSLQAAVIQLDLHALDATPSRADARIEQIQRLLAEVPDVDLVALPEGAWPVDPGAHPGARRKAFLAALPTVPPVVLGANVGAELPTNSLIGLDARGFTRLDKQVLVPGWERRWLGFGRDRYTPGDGAATLEVAGTVVGGLICYEDVVLRRVQRAAAGSLLIAATNDSWNGPGAGSRLHLAHARLAAVSTGRWVLRPALDGPSAILDPWGAAVWRAPWVDAGPGSVGRAQVHLASGWRPGRFALLWDALLALVLCAWIRR